MPPGRTSSSACCHASSVPAASITTSAPSPSPISRAEERRERAALGASADDLRPPAGVADARGEHQPDRAGADDRDPVAGRDPGALDAAQAAGERLDHRGDLGREAARDGEQVDARDRAPARAGTRRRRRSAAGRAGRRARRRPPSSRRRRGGRRTSMPQNSCPNGLGSSPSSTRMSAAERLQVGAVGERDLDPDEHVAGPGLRPRHVLQRAGRRARGSAAPSRREDDLERVRRCGRARAPRRSGASGSTVGSGTRARAGGRRLAHVPRRRRARADERQLAAVDVVEVDLPGGGEDDDGAARRDELERRAPPARTAPPRRRAVRRPARPRRGRSSRAKTSSPARRSTSAKRRPTKPWPTTSTRPRGTRSAPRSTQASGSTYVARASSSAAGTSTHPSRARARRSRPARSSAPANSLARRLVPGPAPVACAARAVVHEHDAPPVVRLGDDLVAEHAAGELGARASRHPSRRARTRAPGGSRRRLLDLRRPAGGRRRLGRRRALCDNRGRSA